MVLRGVQEFAAAKPPAAAALRHRQPALLQQCAPWQQEGKAVDHPVTIVAMERMAQVDDRLSDAPQRVEARARAATSASPSKSTKPGVMRWSAVHFLEVIAQRHADFGHDDAGLRKYNGA